MEAIKEPWESDVNFKRHINNNENPNARPIDWETITNTIIYPDKESIVDRLETIQLSGTSPEILNYNEYKEKVCPNRCWGHEAFKRLNIKWLVC